MSRLFREIPEFDVLLIMLKELGFTGLNDTKVFSIAEIKLDTLDAWAPLMESYYLPCKAKRYFQTLDAKHIITIMRHVLPYYGFKLQSYERQHLGKKRTVYQIHPATPRIIPQGGDICVMFL